MSKVYDEFLVYDLEDTGEKTQLSINPDELQDHLNPEQVLIILREDLRRIYIWKGSKSPVRKRFISSRVAHELQQELIKDSKYHTCKIVSIDQGDELQEFLNAFKLESMEVKERLPDMRYIRNIEREKMKETEQISKNEDLAQKEEDYLSPGFEKKGDDVIISSFAIGTPIKKGKSVKKKLSQETSHGSVQWALEITKEEKEKIKEMILAKEIPENYERQNLILGCTLYGAVSKATKIFGKDVTEIVWEEVKKLPKGMIELENNKLRVYFNPDKGIVEALEVLKVKDSLNKNNEETQKPQTKRRLPKIPNNDD